ncbi:MAG: Cytochrome c [Verrucomicrobia bacterium]|nr:MAG: Cytochrome c [Verrucomicrobiota bacterium]
MDLIPRNARCCDERQLGRLFRTMSMSHVLILLSLLALQPEEPPGFVEAGHKVAVRNCGECHALDNGSVSRMPEAPRFEDLHTLIPVARLGEALDKGWYAEMPHMNVFALGSDERAELTAYVLSLQPKAPPPPARKSRKGRKAD